MADTWSESSRTLPAGLTCAHCASWVFCADKFDRKPGETTCVWDPGRFRVKVELHREAVAGLAAYREALKAAAQDMQFCPQGENDWCPYPDDPDSENRETCGHSATECWMLYWFHLTGAPMPSPDPGQAILTRLKAGERLATDIREALARRKALEPKGAEDFEAAYLREVPCRVNVEIALADYDKAVGRDG